MCKKHRIRLRGNSADIRDSDVSCDSFCPEFVEIAGEDAHADRDFLIRRKKVTVFRHGRAQRCPAETFSFRNQNLTVYHIFVSAAGRFL